jgi:hypothetical protein
MLLLHLRLEGVGPFEGVDLSFTEDDGAPRLVTVIHGGGGVGKSSVLAAIAATRPGHVVALPATNGERDEPAHVIATYALGQDDPERPHSLVLATPTGRAFADDAKETLRRREQAVFERVAREGGFVFASLPNHRWFSRQALSLITPGRTLARYDVRAPLSLEDPSRADLGRETKQILAYAEITGALSRNAPDVKRFANLQEGLRALVGEAAELAGFSYLGLDVPSLEPMFARAGGARVPFDQLPTRARHLVAMVALPVRSLWAARPERPVSEAEGMVTVDDVELHQDASILSRLLPCLRRVLPNVQWIVTTSSDVVAASVDAREVIALRALPGSREVTCFTGPLARTH